MKFKMKTRPGRTRPDPTGCIIKRSEEKEGYSRVFLHSRYSNKNNKNRVQNSLTWLINQSHVSFSVSMFSRRLDFPLSRQRHLLRKLFFFSLPWSDFLIVNFFLLMCVFWLSSLNAVLLVLHQSESLLLSR